MTIFRALAALIVITLAPVNSNAIDINPYIKFLIRQEARRQGVDENFCIAVAHIESRIGDKEFRVGPMGRGTYYGPFGIHRCFLSRWPIQHLDTNIAIGVNALRGGFKSLRRYNASYNEAYAGAIRQAMRKYQHEQEERNLCSLGDK